MREKDWEGIDMRKKNCPARKPRGAQAGSLELPSRWEERSQSPVYEPEIMVAVPTACKGEMVWATNVACCSMTVSSMEVPKPSLRISTPNSLALAAAPYSLAAAMVMSKGRI
jgi:hypothetical protein